ncbi:MAG: hypothetical protein FWE61_04955 [Micrococcales bacterium]|nr:hypothetical protein [Micrococcales bacterium]
MKHHIITVLLLGSLGTLLMSGCSTGSGPAAPTNNNTPDAEAPATTAPVDPLDTTADEAVAAYLAYVDAYNTVGHDGFTEWRSLVRFTTDKEHNGIYESFPSVVESGVYKIGDMVVRNLRVVEYAAEPRGWEQATLQGCRDNSTVQMVYPGRDPVTPPSYIVTVTMTRFVPRDDRGEAVTSPDPVGLGWWRTSDQSTDETRPCGPDGMER